MSAVAVGDYLLQIKDGSNLQPCHTHLCLCVCELVNVGKQAAGSDNAVTSAHRLRWRPSQARFLAGAENTFPGLKC